MKVSKVGVITFHRASNYGAVLQAYALQVALAQLGHNAEVIDYRNPVIEERYERRFWSTLLDPKKLAVALLKNGYSRNRRPVFDRFRNEFIKTSVAVDASQLCSFSNNYDVVVTGSDQVWNPIISGFDESYFLDFVADNIRKVSYSASLGLSEVPRDLRYRYIELLAGFDRITVREDTAASALASIIGYTPTVVLDPTLLMTREQWIERFGTKKNGKKYILLYLLSEDRHMIDYTRHLAHATGMDVRYISQRLFRPRGFTVLDSIGPGEFVQELLGCSALVTNSFHGVAFGANFGLNLHFDKLPARSPVNSRITDFVRKFGLVDRRIGERLLEPRSEDSLEYVAKKINEQRIYSLEVLSELVSG